MSSQESYVKNMILRTLRRASKSGLSYNTVYSHLDYLLARSGNDKIWDFAVGRDGVYSVARHMVTEGLLDKSQFAKAARIMRLTVKGTKLADKLD
jgi:hypothetical protein